MKRRKAILALCVVSALVFSLAACASDGSGPGATGGEGGTVAISVWTMEWDFFQQMTVGAKVAAEERGREIIIHDIKSDQTEQISGAENLFNQGIEAYVISPFAPDAMPPIVDQAHSMDIPVVISDIGTGGSNHDGFIVSDNYGGGVMNGEYAVKMYDEMGLTEKTYVLLRSPPEAEVSQQRNNGAASILDAAGFTCLAEIHTNDTTEVGYATMMDVLAAHPDVSIVVCGEDQTAAGAGQALVDAGRSGDFIVTGFDASDQGIEGLLNGTITSTIQQFPYDMGYIAMNLALDIAEGKTVTYSDAATKEVHIDVFLVTKDNSVANVSDQLVSITGLTRRDIGMD